MQSTADAARRAAAVTAGCSARWIAWGAALQLLAVTHAVCQETAAADGIGTVASAAAGSRSDLSDGVDGHGHAPAAATHLPVTRSAHGQRPVHCCGAGSFDAAAGAGKSALACRACAAGSWSPPCATGCVSRALLPPPSGDSLGEPETRQHSRGLQPTAVALPGGRGAATGRSELCVVMYDDRYARMANASRRHYVRRTRWLNARYCERHGYRFLPYGGGVGGEPGGRAPVTRDGWWE